MVWKLSVKQGSEYVKKVPFMADLLFVYDTRHTLDPLVELDKHFSASLYARLARGHP